MNSSHAPLHVSIDTTNDQIKPDQNYTSAELGHRKVIAVEPMEADGPVMVTLESLFVADGSDDNVTALENNLRSVLASDEYVISDGSDCLVCRSFDR